MQQAVESKQQQLSPPASSGSRSSGPFGFFSATIIMVAALIVMFHPVVFGGKTTMFAANSCSSIMPGGAYAEKPVAGSGSQRARDPVAPATQTEPYLSIIKNSLLKEHKLPLWNPYSGCGLPFLANMQSELFCPLVVLFALFSSPWAVDALVLSRLLVGGILTYLALWTLLPKENRAAGLVGAIGFMFSGYMLDCLNLPEMSVSVMVPSLLLGVESLVQRGGVGSFSLCSFAVAWILFGGMPEISFNALAFSGFYVIVRVLTVDGWKSRARAFGLIAAAYFTGLAIALPQVLPFLEYVKSSFNIHDPSQTGDYAGLIHDADWRRGVLSYLFPGGWAQKCFARGFYGVALSYLAAIGFCVSAWRLFKVRAERATCVIVVFLAAIFAAMMLKRFGCPLVQWYGALPVANMIFYHEYNEPMMALCVAILAAFGVAYVQRGVIKPRWVLAVGVGTWLVASLFYFLFRAGPVLPGFDLPKDLAFSMRLGLGTLVCAVLLCLSSFKSARVRTLLPVLLVLPFLFETYNGYMVNAFYGAGGVSERRLDAYKGAPYVDFLQKHSGGWRVIGFDGVLNPNWPAAFMLPDVRAVDAIYPAVYNSFIGKFVPPLRSRYWDYEEHPDRFNGMEAWMHPTLTVLRRLCILTSTKYLVSIMPLSERPDFILASEPMDATYNKMDGYSWSPSATIDGVAQPVLFQHPRLKISSSAVKFAIAVPRRQPVLHFDFVRNPDVACPPRSKPVEGIVLFNSLEDKSQPLRFEFRNDDPSPLHSTRYSVDLSKFGGQTINVTLASTPMPGSECYWEWVGWKSMRFSEPSAARCIYDKEAKVYELPDPLPHAAIFHQYTIAEDDRACLNLLKSEEFAPFEKIVFVKNDAPVELLAQADAGRRTVASSPANVTKVDSSSVEIDVPPNSAGSILLLTDTFYPGWRAFVDGREARIIRANYCFRAVVLPAGARHVSFQFDPLTLKLGLCASALALLFLGLWFLQGRTRQN
jgi:hypothetical protein